MTIATADTDPAEALRVLFDRLALNLRTAIPGVVVAVGADGTTVDVQPAVSLAQRLETTEEVRLPVIRGVPLQALGSETAGVFVTVPVSVGDDGLLIVCDRALDTWQFGAGVVRAPDAASPRHHDLTDAVFLPGLRRASSPIAAPSSTAVEVRTADGLTRASVSPGVAALHAGVCSVSVTPAGITLTAGPFVLSVTPAGLTIGGEPFDDHRHDLTGGGATGPVTS